MNKKVKKTLEIIGCIIAALCLAWVIYEIESYQIDLYMRKYPGTDVWDYWSDRNNR